jgi:dTDP-4-dehydrorhamnose reductase
MNHVHVVGNSGPLFDNLLQEWRNRFGTVEHTTLDSLDAAVAKIRQRRPQWIVYCGEAAEGSWAGNGLNFPDEPRRVERIVEAGIEADARMLLLSSDAVFSGPKLFHEESELIADDMHCHHLHAIEQAALAPSGQRVLVVRSHPFGWSTPGDSFAEQIWQTLKRGEPLEVDPAAYATPILASDLAELLLRCFRARLHGLLHVGGAERTSQLRFALELATVAGFDRRLVRSKPVDVTAADLSAPQRETSLASRLVRRELGVALPLLRESLLRFAEQATNGYRDRLRGAVHDCTVRAA